MGDPVELINLPGLTPYGEALALQQMLHRQRKQGHRADALILCQHPPVITLGRNAADTEVLVTQEVLEARGVELYQTGRGGQATIHCPGQLVAYPVISLKARGLGVRRYVTLLEEVMLTAASQLGVKAHRREGLAGIYHGGSKLGAVGVMVSGGVTMHGLALNINPDLTLFELINPCGRADIPATSIRRITGAPVEDDKALRQVVAAFARQLDFDPSTPPSSGA